jgi:hypothetical protein
LFCTAILQNKPSAKNACAIEGKWKMQKTKFTPITTVVKAFGFINTAGGTGLSDWAHNPRFSGTAQVAITRVWEDYETGLRFAGKSVDKSLDVYLNENAKPDDRRVFFSEFDLAAPKLAQELRRQVEKGIVLHAMETGVVRTGDGYVFKLCQDAKWSDGDMEFESIHALMEEIDGLEVLESDGGASSVSSK